MNSSFENDLNTLRPRPIPWIRWLLIALGFFMGIAAGLYWWFRDYTTITVAADTTYLTTPLLPDGYPDYIGYLNAQNSAGVTPENNAWVAILRCVGPKEIDENCRAEHFRLLGIAPLPEEGDYLRHFYDIERLKQLPDEVLIAASVAAQLPYHVRFARLAALNAEKGAVRATEEALYAVTEPEGIFILEERLTEAISSAALAIHDYAEDPAAAEAQAAQAVFDANDFYLVGDDEQIQDLRESALNLIMPMFETPEEETLWRKTLFDETAQKLLDREELITSERPWSAAECPLATDWLRTYSPHLDALQRELEQRPRYFCPLVDATGKQGLLSLSYGSIQLLRQFAMAYSTRSRHFREQNDQAAALRDIQSIFALARCCSQKPILIEPLVAIAIQGIAVNCLGEWLQNPALTDDKLRQVAEFLEQQSPLPNLATTIAGERIYCVGEVVSMVARGDDSLEKHSKSSSQSLVCWDEVLREINRLYDQYEAAARIADPTAFDQAYAQALPAARPEFDAMQKDGMPWYLLPSQRTEVMKYLLPRLFLPAVEAARNAFFKAQVRLDLARCYVALERFRRANKKYPATLAELIPAYLPAVPTDQFDGKPLKYFTTPTGGYRAYSIWKNGVDDGGTPNVGDDEPDFNSNDLVIGSPDEIPRKYLLAW